MPQKHTIEFIRDEFKKENYILLSEKYINNKTHLNYICPMGHKGSIRWDSWIRGCRCLTCGGKKKHTISFIQFEFEKGGYTLLTSEYINCEQRLRYICPKGHRGSISWHSWNRGSRCAVCAGNRKLIIGFIRTEFEKEGYILLTSEYVNSDQQLNYICPRGHKENVTWHNWKGGARCYWCYCENNKGSGNPNWNPDLTKEGRNKKRIIPKYEEWRFVVKEKDNFTCQVCGDSSGGNLVSHHLESYNNNPDLRTELDNGVCLCETCHKKFHHEYGYGNTTKKQFEKFQAKTRK